MLTNTASDQDSRAIQVRTGTPVVRIHPAALIAGVAGEGDARPMGHLKTAVEFIEGCAVTWDTSHSRDVVVVLTSSASDTRRHVSDQPARRCQGRQYTRNLATGSAPDRLIADGMQWGYLHAASSLTGITGGGFDSPSTQRHSRAARLPPWRCVLSPSVAAQTQRVREGGGKCSSHATPRSGSSAATCPAATAAISSGVGLSRRSQIRCQPGCSVTSRGSGLRGVSSAGGCDVWSVMPAPALGEHRLMPLDD